MSRTQFQVCEDSDPSYPLKTYQSTEKYKDMNNVYSIYPRVEY